MTDAERRVVLRRFHEQQKVTARQDAIHQPISLTAAMAIVIVAVVILSAAGGYGLAMYFHPVVGR